jgi:hypothetical protein
MPPAAWCEGRRKETSMSVRRNPARRTLALSSVLALIITAPLVTAAATVPAYDIEDLGTLGGPTSDAFGLNAAGQVVGAADPTSGAAHTYL